MYWNIVCCLLGMLLLGSLNSCQETQEETPTITTTVLPESLPRRFMRTQTTRLRVRQTPDLAGAVVKILEEGNLVEYLHDSTTFTTTLTFRQKKYDAPWYKVRADDKTEGWVYAAFVKFLSDEENQKIVVQKETEELLEAANVQRPKFDKKEEKERNQPIRTSVLDQYKAYLGSLDKHDPASTGQAIRRFEALFAGKSNMVTCDAAYAAFFDFYERSLSLLQRKNFGNFQHLAPSLKRYHRATMLDNEQTRLLGDNGFNFGIENGKVVLAPDMDFIYRVFYRECSTPMRAYMNQYQLEVPNFWLDQEELLINPEQLMRWTLSWNYLVATYTDFIWHADAKNRLERHLNILLDGTPKTPAFDDNQVLKEDFKQAYEYVVKRYPDSKIGQSFQHYLEVLEDNDWQASSDVEQGQNKVLRALVL